MSTSPKGPKQLSRFSNNENMGITKISKPKASDSELAFQNEGTSRSGSTLRQTAPNFLSTVETGSEPMTQPRKRQLSLAQEQTHMIQSKEKQLLLEQQQIQAKQAQALEVQKTAFLAALKKIENSKSREGEDMRATENLNIKQRIASINVLGTLIQNQSLLRRENRKVRKEYQNLKHQQIALQRQLKGGSLSSDVASSSERFISSVKNTTDDSKRLYSVFSEGSSSADEDFPMAAPAVDSPDLVDFGDDSTKFPFPVCLSSIILRLQDILNHPEQVEGVKAEYKTEIIRLVQLCLQEQRCLMYKMPFFVLNFLTSPLTNQYSRLDFLKMITKNGREINEAFAPKIFLIVMKVLDPYRLSPEGKDNQLEVCEFLKTLFDFNPDSFNSTQTMLLLTRVCMMGFASVHSRQDITFEVLQIIQFILKYNKYSSTHNLKTMALLALSILCRNNTVTIIAWNIVRNLIFLEPDLMIQELHEILMIGIDSEPKKVEAEQEGEEQKPPSDEIAKQLQRKCFGQYSSEFMGELEELDLQLLQKHQSCLQNQFQEIDPSLTLEELICKMECPQHFKSEKQAQQILEFNSRQAKHFKQLQPELRERFLRDRKDFLGELEKLMNKIKQGAIYFLGMALYGSDNVPTTSYSISRILDLYKDVVTNTTSVSLVTKIIDSIATLIGQVSLTFEWEQLWDIIETLFDQHLRIVIQNKKLIEMNQIFKEANQQIMLGQYQGNEARVFHLYVQMRHRSRETRIFKEIEARADGEKEKSKRLQIKEMFGIPPPNMDIMSQFFDEVLLAQTGLHENFWPLLVHQHFLEETNVEVKLLLMTKILDFYKESQGEPSICELIETSMLQAFDHVFEKEIRSVSLNESLINIKKELSAYIAQPKGEEEKQANASNFNQSVQLKAIDILAFMAHKTRDEGRFKAIIDMLAHPTPEEGHQAQTMEPNAQLKRQQSMSTPAWLSSPLSKIEASSLNRLFQIFKLKAETVDSFKSVYVLDTLLLSFQRGKIEKRRLILDEILSKIRINPMGDLCWVDKGCPLLLGFKEFFRINSCPVCDSHFFAAEANNPEFKEHALRASKMVTSLQTFMHNLIFQLYLDPSSEAVALKQDCLATIRILLMDLFEAEDALHQVKYCYDQQHIMYSGFLDLNYLLNMLISYVNFSQTPAISLQILEILKLFLGSQTYENVAPKKAQLQLNEQAHRGLFRLTLTSLRAQFNLLKGDIAKMDKLKDLQQRMEAGTLPGVEPNSADSHRGGRKKRKPSADVLDKSGEDFYFVPRQRDERSHSANRLEVVDDDEKPPIEFSQVQKKPKKGKAQSNQQYEAILIHDLIKENQVDTSETRSVLTSIRELLAFLAALLEADCKRIEFEDIIDSDPAITEQTHERFSKTTLAKQITEVVFALVRDDHLIFHCLKSLALILRALSRKVVSFKITDPAIRQLLFFMGLRSVLPNVIHAEVDLHEILAEEGIPGLPGVLVYGLLDQLLARTFRKDSDFIKVLHNDIRDLSPIGSDGAQFFEPKQARRSYSMILNCLVSLVEFQPDCDLFGMLKAFTDRVRQLFHDLSHKEFRENLSKYKKRNTLNYPQLGFITFLEDAISLKENHDKVASGPHYLKLGVQAELPQTPASAIEPVRNSGMYLPPLGMVVGSSLVQMNQLSKNQLKLAIQNGQYYYEALYQINQPEQALAGYRAQVNQTKIRNAIGQNQDQSFQSPKEEHEDMPTVLNSVLQTEHQFVLKEQLHQQEHRRFLDQAEGEDLSKRIEAFSSQNLTLIFVSTYYTDSETACDVVSRLGRIEPLANYSQLLTTFTQSAETLKYLSSLQCAIRVSEFTQTFIFVPDLLPTPTAEGQIATPVDFKLLQDVDWTAILFVGSLRPVKEPFQECLTQPMIEDMNVLLGSNLELQSRLDGDKVKCQILKLFRLNSRSYLISSEAKACSHYQPPEEFKDSVFGVGVAGSLKESPDALKVITEKYHSYLEAQQLTKNSNLNHFDQLLSRRQQQRAQAIDSQQSDIGSEQELREEVNRRKEAILEKPETSENKMPMEFEEPESRFAYMSLKIPSKKPWAVLNVPSFSDLVEESSSNRPLVEIIEKERLGLGVALALEEGK